MWRNFVLNLKDSENLSRSTDSLALSPKSVRNFSRDERAFWVSIFSSASKNNINQIEYYIMKKDKKSKINHFGMLFFNACKNLPSISSSTSIPSYPSYVLF